MLALENGYFSDSVKQRLSLDTLDEASLKRLLFEADVLTQLIQSNRSRKSAVKAAVLLGWSVSKVYRVLKRYKQAGNVLVLMQQPPPGGRGKSRLTPEQDEIIAKTLRKFCRNHKKQDVKYFVDLAQAALKDSPPKISERTLRRRYEALSERQKYSQKHGSHAAGDIYRKVIGSTPECVRPLERIQIDHTIGSIVLVSETGYRSLGRPYVTLVIDEFSRIVLAIHITFAAPSIVELAETMSLACVPRDSWLNEHGIMDRHWEHYGKPGSVFVDRGCDFTATPFELGCLKWGIHLQHRQQTHHGGIIERLIGHAEGVTKRFPGNSVMSKAAKLDDIIDPTTTACMTVREYVQELVEYFTTEYHHEVHPALGMTPANKWNLGVHQTGAVEQISKPIDFYIDFLKKEEPTLQRTGLRVDFLHYRGPGMQRLLDRLKSKKMEIRIDPGDVSRAFFYHPLTGDIVEFQAAEVAGMDITQAEWRRHQVFCREWAKGTRITAKQILHSVMIGRWLANEAAHHGVQAQKPQPSGPKGRIARATARKREVDTQRRERSNRRTPPPSKAKLHQELKPLLPRRQMRYLEIGS